MTNRNLRVSCHGLLGDARHAPRQPHETVGRTPHGTVEKGNANERHWHDDIERMETPTRRNTTCVLECVKVGHGCVLTETCRL